MNNITQFTQDKQVQVSEQQLRSLLEFVRIANNRFDEIVHILIILFMVYINGMKFQKVEDVLLFLNHLHI